MTKEEILNICIEKVEKKFNSGSKTTWQNKDFIRLSGEIQDTTKIYISHSSLKRVFGKVDYEYFPQQETRNALCRYVDYESWNDMEEKLPYEQGEKKMLIPRWLLITSIIAILGMALLLTITITNEEDSWVFEASKMTGPAPLNVVFKYDISNIDAEEVCVDFHDFTNPGCVKLDPDKKQIINSFNVTDIYNVTLKADGRILDTIPIVATSTGWESILIHYGNDDNEDDRIRNLFDKEPKIFNGKLYVPPKTVSVYGYDTTDYYIIKHRYLNYISSDGNNFTLTSRFQNISRMGGHDCPDITFTVLGTKSRLRFLLLSPGCASQYSTYEFGEIRMNGIDDDLSMFMCDLSQWNNLEAICIDKNFSLNLNDSIVFQTKYSDDIGTIFGIIIETKGSGAFDHVLIKSLENDTMFYDGFDKL